MKRIAFVDLTNFKNWPAGGMLQYELAILPYLVKEYQVDIWGVSVNGVVNSEIYINDISYPIKTFANVKTKSKLIPNYWRGLQLIFKKKEFKQYDIVYVHTGSCAVALSKIIDRTKTLLVYHQHGLSHLHDYALMSLLQRPFVNKAQYISDLVFVVSDSESVDTYYKTISSKVMGKIKSIGSPIDLTLFTKQKTIHKDNIIKLIYTGRIDSHKDVCTLIEMLNYLKLKTTDFQLTIVGDGDEREKVKRLINYYNLESKVIMRGVQPRKNVLKELIDSDIYVTASIGEGVSISVLEAYASGLPVVCFNVPGLSKQVVNKVTGRVIEKGNVELMADAIVDVMHNLNQYHLNALNEAKKYDSEIISKIIITEINKSFSKLEAN